MTNVKRSGKKNNVVHCSMVPGSKRRPKERHLTEGTGQRAKNTFTV
jgi:hypothetical protein